MMLLVVFGYGLGTSHSTAVRFGSGGYEIALVGRSADRMTAGVERLASQGIRATSYRCDAGDPDAIRATLSSIRHDQGPVSALLWTAFRNGPVQDVLESAPEEIGDVFRVGVAGLLTAVQACLPDLRASAGAVLVANGALGDDSTEAETRAVDYGIDGTALEDAAKSKLVGLLAERLRGDGVSVGEVVVDGRIRRTERASAESATAIEPDAIAEVFWDIAHVPGGATHRRVTEST